jgi:hypothetical protein
MLTGCWTCEPDEFQLEVVVAIYRQVPNLRRLVPQESAATAGTD